MESFLTLSSDCKHSRNGCCSKCNLNQCFSISPAEEQMRRNFSNSSLKSNGTIKSRPLSPCTTSNELPSCAPMPVLKPTNPQNDQDSMQEDAYTSFSDLKKFSNVKIQEENNKDNEITYVTAPLVEPQNLLMRLFESEMFNLSMAMHYLHASNEKVIKMFLGSKLFDFPHDEVDFYIPQLIYLYIHENDVASAVHPYIEKRCKESVHFSLLCLWFLESCSVGRLRIRDKSLSQGEILRQMIINDFRPPKKTSCLAPTQTLGLVPNAMLSGAVLSAANLDTNLTRSESASSSLRYMNLTPSTLSSGRSLDNGCRCFDENHRDECVCGADRLLGEKEFVSWLTRIGSRLTESPTKPEKTRRLISELLILNMQLPARVWIPLHSNHIVLRIPPTNSCVLNSKDKAPYCIFVEILHCDDVNKVLVPKSLTEAECELNRRLRSTSLANLAEIPDGSPIDFETNLTEPVENTSTETLNEINSLPDMAWETKSMESSASEPVTGRGILQKSKLGRSIKKWTRRPSRLVAHPDDPSASTMSEPWEEKKDRIRMASPYGRLPGWDLLPVIVKSGDDLAQELIAYQLLVTLKSIWEEEQVALYLRPYKILVTSPDSGMLEPIVDACSLHQIKRNQMLQDNKVAVPSLLNHFVESFGPIRSAGYIRAQQNFVESCAAYSLVCYFLQVKDRHNGNILIDADGHLIHIDFGFMLSVSPKNLGFETAHFKLTTEFIDVMGGYDSDMFCYFRTLLLKGLIAARKHCDRIMTVVEISSKGSHLPCFRGGPTAVKAMKDRFHIAFTDKDLSILVDSMVDQSRDSLTTRLYDNFQYYTNGIL